MAKRPSKAALQASLIDAEIAETAGSSDPPAIEEVEVEAAPKVAFDPLTTEGIYDIPEAHYHADPCVQPSLSRSVLVRLVDYSPRHAWMIHPKLGALPEQEDAGSDDEVMDYGTAAHASFLQNKSIIDRLDFDSWRTKDSKAARAQSYADGRIPLLVKSYDRAQRLIDALEDFRARTGAFTKGKPEQTVIWKEGSIWCRCRVDWLPDEPEAAPWDLKTTGSFATLAAWTRLAFSGGYDIQSSFYGRGIECVRGEPPSPMRFCVIEQRPPHGIGVFEMSPIALDLADDRVRTGINLWSDCLASGEWPSYPIETQMIDPPAYVLRARESQALISPRNQDLLRGRDHANTAGYISSGNFGG